MGDLGVLFRKEPIDLFGPAEDLLGLHAHSIALPELAFPQEAANGEVHGVVRRDGVQSPDLDLLLQQPRHQVAMRTRVHADVALLVRLFAELRVSVPPGVQDQDVSLPHLDLGLDHQYPRG